MSRDALFCAILDHPEEDTPRLIFADWLDEHGEADRAEFIRVQIELSRLAPGQDEQSRLAFNEGDQWSLSNRLESVFAQVAAERAALEHGRYSELKLREQELLEDHGDSWSEPLRPFVVNEGFFPALVFRRGFVERTRVSLSSFVTNAESL